MSTTILDGGMGQEIIKRAGETTSLWSVKSLLENPDLVGEVHRDYFNAGAEIATTNTYTVLPDRLMHHDMADQLESLQEIACKQAVNARDAHGSGLVAGSLGPQGFSYQPDRSPPAAVAAEVYDRVCKLQKDYVDIYIAETMSSIDQARGALMGTDPHGKPVWIAFSVDDSDGSKLRSGESIKAIKALVEEFAPVAVLVNCSVPEAVTQAVAGLKEIGVPLGAYANGFTSISDAFDGFGATSDLLEKRKDLGPDAYAEFAEQWIRDGASIIGGCCEVGPAHIETLKQRLG